MSKTDAVLIRLPCGHTPTDYFELGKVLHPDGRRAIDLYLTVTMDGTESTVRLTDEAVEQIRVCLNDLYEIERRLM